ncbi:MAG: sensor histidine kinase [Armatimonadota bacterium]
MKRLPPRSLHPDRKSMKESARTLAAASTTARNASADLERKERQLTILHEMSLATPLLATERVVRLVVDRATSALDAHTGSLLLRDRGTDMLRMAASVGIAADVSDSVTLLVGERIAGRVAASRQAILLNSDPRQHPMLRGEGDIDRRPEVSSSLCAPVLGPGDGEALGVICVSRHCPSAPFTESDLRVLSLFASQAGAAIARQQAVDDLVREAADRSSLEREMARSAHLAEMGRFAATVAHELRNPLGAIKGAAQYLISESRERPDLVDFLQIVVDEVDGLGRLTSDLLDFSKPSFPNRTDEDLVRVVREEIEWLRPDLGRIGASEVVLRSAPATAPCRIDRGQIDRALRNILINGAQAIASVANTRANGAIEIRV